MKVPVPLSKEEKKEAKLMAVIVVLIYNCHMLDKLNPQP